MAKLTLIDITNLQNESTTITALKSNNDVTEIAMENTLSRDGLAPNQMLSNFDMNNYKIINLPDALTDQEPATLSQLNDARTVPLGQVIGTNIQAWDTDLDALAGLATTGLIARTGAGIAATRTVTGTANEITLINGDGVSGNPTISLPAALTFTGKTVTNGTINGATLGATTLAGTISGGGNQINNVVIGTVTPLAGTFTTITGSDNIIVTKTSGIQSTNLFATGDRSLLSLQGLGGGAFYINDTNAGTNLKTFNIDSISGLLTVRSLNDNGTVKNVFLSLDSSTGDIAFSATRITSGTKFEFANNANANYVVTSFSNSNTGASAAVSNTLGATNAGGMSFQATSSAGGGFSLWRWTGAGGLFIDQQNAAGEITFRTGATPTNALRILTDQQTVFTSTLNMVIPGATTSSTVWNDSSASGVIWTTGPRTGTGGATLFGFSGGSIGLINTWDGINGDLVGRGGLFSNAPLRGVGYTTGAGGTVTQATNRTTGVTLNKVSGAITLFSQVNTAVSQATAQSFTVTNSTVAATDTISTSQKSGTDKYEIFVTNVAAGSFQITNYAVAGTTNEAPVFNFNVIKGVTS